MPKNIIDYSHTIIYKIYCKDERVTDLYVGHTTNFDKRKNQHKMCCNNGNKLKLYQTIRNNGGWENWDIVEIATFNCKDNTEARIKEQEQYELLKPSLNALTPYSDKNKYFCQECNVQCDTLLNYNIHIQTNKHHCKTNLTEKQMNEIKYKYVCKKCDFKCLKKGDYNRHIIRPKHMENINACKKVSSNYICNLCNVEYASRNGIWYHKKTCNIPQQSITQNLIIDLIKDNKEMKQLIYNQNNVINNFIQNFISNTNNLTTI
jgi:hypothetical protein